MTCMTDEIDSAGGVVEEMASRYYGKYRGWVVENEDPEGRGRLRLAVPAVLGKEGVTGWALPCLPFGGIADQGLFTVPEPGAQVWVEFEAGELSKPIWTGTFWQTKDDVPEEAQREAPTARVLKTPAGHALVMDDEEDAEQIRLVHPEGTELLMDEKGSVKLTDGGGATVTMDAEAGELTVEDSNGNRMVMSSSGTTVEDANGNKVEMAASGVTVEGAQVVIKGQQVGLAGSGGEPVLKGQSFLTLFMAHTHPTAVGPSGPPIPTGSELNALSMKVMTG